MWQSIERWLIPWASGAPYWRFALWAGFTVLLCIGGAAGLWRPAHKAQQQLMDLYHRQYLEIRPRQQRIRKLPIYLPSPETRAPRPRFSVLGFLDRSGGRLESWLPGTGEAGTLTLLQDWERLPGVFPLLMEYAIGLDGFSIEPREGRLLIALVLIPEAP